jgi:hypothetical protein
MEIQLQIEILKQRFGTYQKVADHLEITYRHLLNLKKGMPPSSALLFRITQVAGNLKRK